MKKYVLVSIYLLMFLFGCKTGADNAQVKDDQTARRDGIDSFYDQMRQFRPYIEILDATPYHDHFSIAFDLPTERRALELYLHLSDLATLPSFLNTSDSLKIQRLMTPSTIIASEIPGPLSDVATRIRAQIRIDYPSAQNLKIRYDGSLRFIGVREFMPRSVQGMPVNEKKFSVTQYLMSVVKGSSEPVISEFPRVATNRTTRYCFQSQRPDGTYEPNLCGIRPKLVGYMAPKDFGGQSPLAYHMTFEHSNNKGPIASLNEESLKARKAILNALMSIDAGSYVNPASDIIASYGEETPKDLNLSFVLNLTCDLERSSSGDSITENALIGFSHQDLRDGKTYSAVLPKSKLTASATLMQGSMVLSLKKKNSSKAYSVEVASDDDIEWIPLNGHNYPKNGSLEIRGSFDFVIPADTTFSSYNCYVDALGDGEFQAGGHISGFSIK